MACNCGTVLSIGGSSTSNTGCICFRDYTNLCEDGPAPCGDTLDLDISDRVSNSINTSDTNFSVHSFDQTAFASVTVSAEGVISMETTADAVEGKRYTITLKVTTTGGDGNEYAVFGDVFICIEKTCNGVDCPEGQECNPCTGLCEDTVADLEI